MLEICRKAGIYLRHRRGPRTLDPLEAAWLVLDVHELVHGEVGHRYADRHLLRLRLASADAYDNAMCESFFATLSNAS